MKGEIVLDTLVDYDREPCKLQVKDHRVIFSRDDPIAAELQTEKKSERLKAAKEKRRTKQQNKENPSSVCIDNDKGYSTDTAVGSKRPNSKRVSFEKDTEMSLTKKRKLDLSSKSLVHIHGIQKQLIQDAPTFLEVKDHLRKILNSYESETG